MRSIGRLVMVLCVFGAFFAADAAAFNVNVSTTPTTTQAGGHPNFKLQLTRTGSDSEDLKDLQIDLPPGLIGNPEAASAKCTKAQFQADSCPQGSTVGTVEAVASALVLTLPPVPGTIYVLQPDPDDAATLGIVLRPPVPVAIDKMFSVGHIKTFKTDDGDFGLRNLVMNMPRQVKLLLGLVPVDITLQSLTLTLNSKASSGFFMTNPTSCQPARTAVRAVSYSNQVATTQTSYTPTNCEAVPFDPTLDFTMDSTSAGSRGRPTVTINVPSADDPLAQSHVSDVKAKFPPGISLDILQAFAVEVCSDAQLEADSCPPNSKIGGATVTVPVLPPDFTGDVYRVPPGPTDVYAFGLVLRGPRGVKATARGGSFIDSIDIPGEGFVIRLNSDFLNLPQIPFTKFELALTRDFFVNPPACVNRTAQATVIGHSGAVRDLTDPYTMAGC